MSGQNDFDDDGKPLADLLNKIQDDKIDPIHQDSIHKGSIHKGYAPKTSGMNRLDADEIKNQPKAKSHFRQAYQPSPKAALAPSSEKMDGLSQSLLCDIWDTKITYSLSSEVSANILQSLFNQLTPLSLEEQKLTLIAETRQAYLNMDESYKRRIMRAFSQLRMPQYIVKKIDIIMREDVINGGYNLQNDTPQNHIIQKETGIEGIDHRSFQKQGTSIGASYRKLTNPFPEDSALAHHYDKLCFPIDLEKTFDSFLQDDSNRKAFLAANDFVANILAGKSPQIIFHGTTSTGKTHLLNAIVIELKKAKPELRILYSKSNVLKYAMNDAIRDRAMSKFRNVFRNIDILIFDDAHFLPPKGTFSEELYHIICEHQDHGRAMISASQQHPAEISHYSQNLRSRLQAGICIGIDILRKTTTLELLRNYSKKDRTFMRLNDEMICLIARNTKSGYRGMVSQIENLKFHFRAHNITAESSSGEIMREVRNYLNLHQLAPRKISGSEIIDATVKHFHITKAELESRQRTFHIKQCRHVCFYLLRALGNQTYPMVARDMKFDHSTVMNGTKNIAKLIETDPAFRLEIEELIEKIKQAPAKDWS